MERLICAVTNERVTHTIGHRDLLSAEQLKLIESRFIHRDTQPTHHRDSQSAEQLKLMDRRMRNRKYAAATRKRKKENMAAMLEELEQLRRVSVSVGGG